MKKIIIILIFILLSGCVNKQELDTLHQQLAQEQQQRAALGQKIKELSEQLQTTDQSLRQEIAQSSQPVRFSQANIVEELKSIRMQLATIEGQVDEIGRLAQSHEQIVNNNTKDIISLGKRTKHLQSLWQQAASQLGLEAGEAQKEPLASTPISSPAPTKAASPQQDTASKPKSKVETNTPQKFNAAQELYKKALEAFYAKDYPLAQSLWAQFAQTFKTNPLVPNSYFWQGEAYYQQGNYAQAVLSYQQVISKYPKSNKYRPALLKQGLAFFKLGKKEAGKIVLEDLIKQNGDSLEAKRAKNFLQNPS